MKAELWIVPTVSLLVYQLVKVHVMRSNVPFEVEFSRDMYASSFYDSSRMMGSTGSLSDCLNGLSTSATRCVAFVGVVGVGSCFSCSSFLGESPPVLHFLLVTSSSLPVLFVDTAETADA